MLTKRFFAVTILISLTVILSGCNATKKTSTIEFAFSSYLGQSQDSVLQDLSEQKIDLDERSNPDQGYVIVQETIQGIKFQTIINFAKLSEEEEAIASNLMRHAEVDLSQKETRDNLNILYAAMQKTYGEPVESGSNNVEVDGVTYLYDEIPDESIRKLLTEGMLFDDSRVSALQMNWQRTDRGTVSLSISEQNGITIYEESAKAAEISKNF